MIFSGEVVAMTRMSSRSLARHGLVVQRHGYSHGWIVFPGASEVGRLWCSLGTCLVVMLLLSVVFVHTESRWRYVSVSCSRQRL